MPEGHYMANGIVTFQTDQRWLGVGQRTVISQLLYGRMIFDLPPVASGSQIEMLSFRELGNRISTPNWSYTAQDAATNALYQQDSRISRCANIFVCGASRVRLRHLHFYDCVTGIRMRALDRYAGTRPNDNEITNCYCNDTDLGMLPNNQRNLKIDNIHGRHTSAATTNFPHLIYFPGPSEPPSEVIYGLPVLGSSSTDLFSTSSEHGFDEGTGVRFTGIAGGAPLVEGTVYYVIADSLTATTFKVSGTKGGASIDLTTSSTAGSVSATPFESTNDGGSITNCTDYDNRISSSYKLRNLRGFFIGNLQSSYTARGMDLSFCEYVTVDGYRIHELQRALDGGFGENWESGGAPGNDTAAAGISVISCANSVLRGVDIQMAAGNEWTNGITVSDNSVNVRVIKPHVSVDWPAATATGRSLYRIVASTGVLLDEPSYTQKGADQPVIRVYGAGQNVINRPRGRAANPLWNRFVWFQTDTSGNVVVIDRDLLNFPVTRDAIKYYDLSGLNTVKFTSAN